MAVDYSPPITTPGPQISRFRFSQEKKSVRWAHADLDFSALFVSPTSPIGHLQAIPCPRLTSRFLSMHCCLEQESARPVQSSPVQSPRGDERGSSFIKHGSIRSLYFLCSSLPIIHTPRHYAMKAPAVLLLAASSVVTGAAAGPVVHDADKDVTYHGLSRNGIEVFLNIPYGQDTSGENRFRPPRPHSSPRGSAIDATAYGPACPQALGPWVPPISLTNITKISEDCLNLNIARPEGECVEGEKLPVLVYIHGGSFWAGSNEEITIRPDGMILESVKNGLPVIHVAMNYRLGCEYSSMVPEDNS